MDRQLIDRYAAGGDLLRRSIAGLSRQELLAPLAAGAPGKWTIQEVVIHLMDSDLIGADRMKRVIAEDNPTLIGYDEGRFVSHLYYGEQVAEDAVTLVDLNRQQFARVLRKLPPVAFDRAGTHNERGRLTLGHMLDDYVGHLEHHLRFIHGKRERLGKPAR